MFGWMNVRITPPTRICTPSTASSSAASSRSARRVRTPGRARPARSPADQQRLEQLDEEVHAVLQLVHHADAEEQPGDAQRASSVPHRRVPPNGRPPDEVEDTSPTRIQNSCMPRPRSELAFGGRRRAPRSGSRTSTGTGGSSPASAPSPASAAAARAGRRAAARREVELEERAAPAWSRSRPSRGRLLKRPDQVGAPDGDGEDRDLRPRVERRDGRAASARGDRQPEQDHDELPAGEEGEVVVDADAAAAAAARRAGPRGSAPPTRTGVNTMFMFRTSVQTM